MTLSEFKAWFEGYTEGMDGAPNEKQWKRVKAKVAEITGEPITRQVWVDHYRHYWGNPVWNGLTGWQNGNIGYAAGAVAQNGVGTASLMGMQAAVGAAPQAARYEAGPDQTVEWDSHAAMYAAGKADAAAA